ncbi:MAG: diacylglycerol kinase family protein [Croceibacterium sp.]
MDTPRAIWLVNNASSGSNDQQAQAALEQCCASNGFHVAHRTVFPDQDLPTAGILGAAGIDTVAVFAGDGTVNALIAALAGWDGAVLILAGGTMNLLYHRLHGTRSLEEVVAIAAKGQAKRHRPGVIRSRQGVTYAGILAGPGASWGDVREAMRDQAVIELAQSAAKAIQETLGGEMICCSDPALGRREGYPLINLTPTDAGIEIDAYSSENARDYLGQAWALLKLDFRSGPHERLGVLPRVVLASTQGSAFGLLIDGEQVECGAEEEFTLAQAEVDLLATA